MAAVLSRVYPDATGDAAQAELTRLLKSVKTRVHGVLKEMHVPAARANLAAKKYGNPDGGFLSLGGPLVSAHLNAFAAKMGFALHFHATGTPVREGGGVIARIFTNLDAIDGQLPRDMIEMMGDPRTLVQGRFNVGDQFLFQTIRATDAVMSASFSSFRLSFSITTFAADSVEKLDIDGVEQPILFRPGDLKTPTS